MRTVRNYRCHKTEEGLYEAYIPKNSTLMSVFIWREIFHFFAMVDKEEGEMEYRRFTILRVKDEVPDSYVYVDSMTARHGIIHIFEVGK